MSRALGLVVLLASLVSAVALGHGSTKPLHGGVVKIVGEISFELVAKPDGAELYVIDDGEDIVSEHVTALLIIDAAGVKSEVVMLPAGGNKFETKEAKLPSGVKVAVLLTAPNESKTTARFTIE